MPVCIFFECRSDHRGADNDPPETPWTESTCLFARAPAAGFSRSGSGRWLFSDAVDEFFYPESAQGKH